MRIAFTSTNNGGIETYVNMVSRWLIKNGHTVHLVYNRGMPNEQDKHPALHYHIAPPGSIHYYLTKFSNRTQKLAKAMRFYEDSIASAKMLSFLKQTDQIDLAEINDLTFHPRLLGDLPFIYKMHGADWVFSHYCENKDYVLTHTKRQQDVLNYADQVHVVSRSERDFVSGACKYSPRLIHVTPNPIDTKVFCPSELPALGPPFKLMNVGRIESRKGTHILVAAMRDVWRHEPETHLYIFTGLTNGGIEQMDAIVSPDEHKGRIHFVEGLSPTELVRHYQNSHLCIVPARYETFGYTILEAMACGRPVIATDIGPIPELVRHEENGWLVPRDDVKALATTIVSALRQPERLEAYGKAGRKHAEHFDVEQLMPEQLNLYEQVLAAKYKLSRNAV